MESTPANQSTEPDQPLPPSGDKLAIPGHVLLQQIARGSYGEVWLARSDLGTLRAVKIVRRSKFTDSKPYDREFAGIQRYEPVSREHEGLVDVLQVGRDDKTGFFFYVMELADDAGETANQKSEIRNQKSDAGNRQSAIANWQSYVPLTLSHAIRTRTRLPVGEVVELGIALAQALEFLHSRRLLHRDVKPQNIIFVGGRPKLADVGLVAEVDGPQTLVGTDGYIPPEGPGSVQADIYSLGKVLYEAATGKDRQEFPDLPTRLVAADVSPLHLAAEKVRADSRPLLPPKEAGDESTAEIARTPPGEQPDFSLPELNEVLLKACESDRQARYQSAAAMVEDLARIKAGQSLRARRARRRRIRFIGTAIGAVTALAILAGSVHFFFQYQHQKPRLLFREIFDAAQPDTNRWAFGHLESYGLDGYLGRPQFQVSQTGGELVLRAEAEHTNGYTCGQTFWADVLWGAPGQESHRIEVELSGSTLEGYLRVVVPTAETPSTAGSLPGIELARLDPVDRKTNPWSPRRLRLDVLDGGRAGIVFQDANRRDQFDVLDLKAKSANPLRFYVHARSSRGMPPAWVELRIKEVVAFTVPRNNFAVGRVIEVPSEWPVADVVIKDRSGQVLAKTGGNGAFAVPFNSERGPLVFERDGFALVDGRPSVNPALNEFTLVPLRNLKPGFGAVVDSIPVAGRSVAGIGFRGDVLMAVVHDWYTNCALVPIDLVARRLSSSSVGELRFDFPDGKLFGEFAKCGDRLIAVKSWPGAIVDLTSGESQKLKELKHPDGSLLSYPFGCTFDGELLWFVEHDPTNKQFGIRAFDFKRNEVVHWVTSADKTITGIAWDGKSFWISNGDGLVYEVDREVALRMGSVDMARLRQFRGSYSRLAYGLGYLWGLDQNGRVIHKIKIKD